MTPYIGPYHTEKLVASEWQVIARFRGDDDEILATHAAAFGGRVRLMRGDRVVREWADGVQMATGETRPR